MTSRLAGTILGAAAGMLVVTTVAVAQQGWSHADTIKQGTGGATLNSLVYDYKDVWIVGGDGLILKSEDEGHSFQQLDPPASAGLSAGLNDVFVLDGRVWIVGDAGTILLGKKGGKSFVKNVFGGRRAKNGNGPLDLYSVEFVDKNDGYIVGDEGLILVSSDGGVTWREQRSPVTTQLFHLGFRGKRGWIVGSAGVILHTGDGGKNWYPSTRGLTGT